MKNIFNQNMLIGIAVGALGAYAIKEMMKPKAASTSNGEETSSACGCSNASGVVPGGVIQWCEPGNTPTGACADFLYNCSSLGLPGSWDASTGVAACATGSMAERLQLRKLMNRRRSRR